MAVNILFITQDDNFTSDMIGYSIESNMSNHEHIQVYSVQNEQEAYKVLNTQHVHMIIIDFDINNMNCDRFIDLMKIDSHFKKIPIAIISENKFIERKAFELGVVDFFKKPIAIEELLDKIFSTLSPFHEVNKIVNHLDIETTEELIALLRKNIKYNTFVKNALEDEMNKVDKEKLIEVCNSMKNINQRILHHIGDISKK